MGSSAGWAACSTPLIASGSGLRSWSGWAPAASCRTPPWTGCRRYRFSGDIWAYREGDLYGAGSPVLTVQGSFGETVLLETVVLSILNHDSGGGSGGGPHRGRRRRPTGHRNGRPADRSGGRGRRRPGGVDRRLRQHLQPRGRARYGVPTAGTAAHAFTLLFGDESQAFAAQVDALGHDTTLLVDTYDTGQGIRAAVAASGGRLGAVRIDSGDLPRKRRSGPGGCSTISAPPTPGSSSPATWTKPPSGGSLPALRWTATAWARAW